MVSRATKTKLKVKPEPVVGVKAKGGASQPFLEPKAFPEYVFGLVGPIGVNLDPIISLISHQLKAPGYVTKVIRLSSLIETALQTDHSSKPEHERIDALMNEGTRLRESSERGDAIALLAIAEIARLRAEELAGREEKNAFILRSLKHPQEVQTLRNIYGKGFVLISVYSPRDTRVSALADRISKSQYGERKNARSRAEVLVERDESEDDKTLGQDVKDAFPLADLFVDGRNEDTLKVQIKRFIDLLFGYRFHTPSRDEHGMYHARSAALRSADLNRQVGAAIMRPEGDVISVGCNDVPKAGGDLYWPDDPNDARDFKKGSDSSADQRVQVLGELLGKLSKAGILPKTNPPTDIHKLVKSLISGNQKHILKGASVMNILEFGRSVHAEMAALMTAARLGVSVRGATLFCTTFPCHMCARHIVASGIKRVVYVEPYPKSRAKQLHVDSICVDPITASDSSVNFEPFNGIAPRQYLEIFDQGDNRKDADGKAVDWRMIDGKPRFLRFLNTYLDLETAISGETVPEMIRKIGVNGKLDLGEGNTKEKP
jgi:deoxycytidylate deaminase